MHPRARLAIGHLARRLRAMTRLFLLPGLAIALMALASCAPPTRPVAGPGDAAQSISWLYLGADGPVQEDMAFRFGGHADARAGVALQSLSRNRLSLSVSCDGVARLRQTPWGPEQPEPGAQPAWAKPDTPLRAQLGPRARDHLVLDLSPDVSFCRLRVQTGADDGYNLKLLRDEAARQALAAPSPAPAMRRRGAALQPVSGDALAAVFHAQRPLAMTAALPMGDTRLLPGARQSLNARIEALTGSPVSEALLASGDPNIPLDFSNAPELDAIYISYLYIAADFSGALMARMLVWHAMRGTEVRILVSDVLHGRAERAFFDGLAARYPRIQLQPFRFAPRLGDGAETRLAGFHRANHAKLMLTMARDPARSRAILGGRNWRDSYLMGEAQDLSAFPGLGYGGALPGLTLFRFRTFEDFDIKFAGSDLVTAIAVQFLELWHRDQVSGRPFDWPYATPAPAPHAAPAPALAKADSRARHFLSIPWVDGRAQTDLFVDLIDATRESIHIATPFINLTPALEAALDRAVARGVSVRLVSVLEREGLDGVYLNSLARAFTHHWAGRLALYDFFDGDPALHSKIYVFDRRLSLITASNLNQRSFHHDVENGLIVLDRDFAAQSVAVVEGYISRSRRARATEAGPAPTGPAKLLLRQNWLRRVF